jgi:hypothetical protein
MVRHVLCAPRSLQLAPIKNADKIKQSVQHVVMVSVMAVSYSRSKLIKKKMDKLVSLQVDDLNHKNILLTKAVITDKAKSFFLNFKKL